MRFESGGHRIQRVPPTERRGRVHTSTVTVAVTRSVAVDIALRECDISVSWFSGTGSGGQRRNKCMSSCRLTHIPTGITATAQTRSRQNSYQTAYDELARRVSDLNRKALFSSAAKDRKEQVGSGQRGDKIRTYRFQDDVVVDHRTNKKIRCSDVMKGSFVQLW